MVTRANRAAAKTWTPCGGWLDAAPTLPPLATDPARVAERLLFAALRHRLARGQLGTGRRGDYGEPVLPSRVRVATFTASDLHHWWTLVSAALTSLPRNDAQRLELPTLLTSDARPVLAVLRDQTPALVLRTRMVADAVRAQKPAKKPCRGRVSA